MEVAIEGRPSSSELSRRAWTSARAAFGSMKLLFVSAFLVYVLIAILFLKIPAWLPHIQSRIADAAILFSVLLAKLLLQASITAPLAVAVHRFILLNKRTHGIISLWPSYTRLFLLWLLGFYAVALLVGLLGGMSDHFWAGGKLVYWVALIALCVAYLMSVLVFPAVAIEAPSSGWRERIGTSWRQMDGRFWTFVWATVLTELPIIIVFIAVFIVWGIADIYILRDLDFHGPFSFVLEIAREALNPLLIVLGAAVASWLYASAQQVPVER